MSYKLYDISGTTNQQIGMALAVCQGVDKTLEKTFGYILLAAIIWLPTVILAAEITQHPPVPARWRNYAYHDIYFNTWKRKGTPEEQVPGDEPGTIRPLYHFQVPITNSLLFGGSRYNLEFKAPWYRINSKLLEKSVLYWGTRSVDLRMYIMDRDLEKHAIEVDAKSGGIDLRQDQWMIKLRSQGTYLVWSNDKNNVPFMIKKTAEADASEPHSQLLMALAAHRFRKFPIAFFPEFGPMAVSNLDIGMNDGHYLVRPLEIMGQVIPENYMPEPLHGLLDPSSGIIARLAKAAKMTEEQWLDRVYIKELARVVAESQYRLGMFHASHTQNLVPFVDYSTGQIILAIRDLRDVYWDYRIMQKFYPFAVDGQIVHSTNTINRTRPEFKLKLKHAMVPGLQFSLYTFQSISSVTPDPEQQSKLGVAFARYFVENVSRITNLKLSESKPIQNILIKIAKSSEPTFSHEYEYKKGDPHVIPGLNGAVSELVQLIYEETMQAQIRALRKVAPGQVLLEKSLQYVYSSMYPYSQSSLAPDAHKTILEKWSTPGALNFELIDLQILVSDGETGQPLSLSFNLGSRFECNFILNSAEEDD